MILHKHRDRRCLSVKSVRGGGVPSPTLAAASSEFASCACLNFLSTCLLCSLSIAIAASKTRTIPRIAATGTPPTDPPAVAVANPTPCWNSSVVSSSKSSSYTTVMFSAMGHMVGFGVGSFVGRRVWSGWQVAQHSIRRSYCHLRVENVASMAWRWRLFPASTPSLRPCESKGIGRPSPLPAWQRQEEP